MTAQTITSRATKCAAFRWVDGMKTLKHGRVCGEKYLVISDHDEAGSWVDCTDTLNDWQQAIPDLSDPATLGCVTQLVREAWGDRDPYVVNDSGHPRGPWFVMTNHSDAAPCIASGATEGEALIKALEAAPSVKR